MPSNPLTRDGWLAVPRSTAALFSGSPYAHAPTALAASAIGFPSDPLVLRIQAHAKATLPEPTYNHSMRVYCFGAAMVRQQFPEHAAALSMATYALACLLHDIATTTEELEGTRLSFEFRGGLMAMELLRGGGWGSAAGGSSTGHGPSSEDGGDGHSPSDGRSISDGLSLSAKDAASQAEAVAEAIMRHQDLGSSGKITLLGQVLQLATIYDNVTPNPELVHRSTLETVTALFPRLGWLGCFAATVRRECELKPWAHTTALGETEFPESVLANQTMKEFE